MSSIFDERVRIVPKYLAGVFSKTSWTEWHCHYPLHSKEAEHAATEGYQAFLKHIKQFSDCTGAVFRWYLLERLPHLIPEESDRMYRVVCRGDVSGIRDDRPSFNPYERPPNVNVIVGPLYYWIDEVVPLAEKAE